MKYLLLGLVAVFVVGCGSVASNEPNGPSVAQMRAAKKETAEPKREIIDRSETPRINHINNTQTINQSQRNTQLNYQRNTFY